MSAAVSSRARQQLSSILSIGLVVLLGTLLLEVLLEGWLVVVLGDRHTDATGNIILDQAGWPKTLKSTLYFAVLAVTLAKFTVDRQWSRLRTQADLALVALGVVMVAAGLIAGSSAVLIGQALFVYFRGAIVFFAWRALDPSWQLIKRFLWIFGGIVAAYAAIAFWQMLVGYSTYPALGWVDLTWARIDRAHALLTHPNDLGHVTGLMLLGLLAWFVTSPRVALRWWALFGLVAIGLAASQSRESVLGVVLGAVLIAILRRANLRRTLIALGLVVVTALVPLVISPSNRTEWARRLGGVISAFEVPSGSEASQQPNTDITCEPEPECSAPEIPPREIRVLYYQQGLRLWTHQPVLGYGVGQFGGIVAYRDDPNWNLDPRFGPNGFDRHGFRAKTVDSFWLHLLVETGALGIIAYLVWMFLMGVPLLRDARGAGNASRATSFWGPAALVFGAVMAMFAPSLEDPLFPPIMFSIVGIAWAVLQRGATSPADERLIEATPHPVSSATGTPQLPVEAERT